MMKRSGITTFTAMMLLMVSAACSPIAQDKIAQTASKEISERMAQQAAVSQSGIVPLSPSTLDWDIADGRFYTQTNRKSIGTSATGFSVTNRDGIPFWTGFTAVGGEQALGYPLSRRFDWRGKPSQVFNRGVLQWDSISRQVLLVNILDVMGDAGKDDWLRQTHATPLPLPVTFDAGKSWEKVVQDRVALLRANPVIEKVYLQTPYPLAVYGLPASRPEDMGNHVTIRFQRGVIREWKLDWMGFKAGDIVVENVGEWAIEAGMFPLEALIPGSATDPEEAQTDSVAESQRSSTPPRPRIVGAAPQIAPAPSNTLRVGNTDRMGVYIRRTPRLDDRLMAWPDNTQMLPTGTTTSVEGLAWTQVRDPLGNVGWVPDRYLIR